MLKKLWKGISNNGIKDGLALDLQQNIILTNQFAITWIFLIIPYIAIFLRYDVIGSYLLGIMVLMHVLVLLLNSLNRYNISRMIEALVPQWIIYLLAAFVYNKPMNDRLSSFVLLNLAFLVIPFLIYSIREYRFISISILNSILCFLSFNELNRRIQLAFSSDLYTQRWFELFNYFIAAGLIIIGFIYLKSLSNQYFNKVNQLLFEANERNELLKKKNYEISKQRDIIYYQNKEIISSIEYASYIQKAVLPPIHVLTSKFPKSFIYYNPKEQVGGDFYWIEHLEDRSIIVVGDCTGHGVPGGFLSMLAIAYLDEIIIKNANYEPAEILNKLREKFIKTFQTDNKYGNKDGVDLAIIVINHSQDELEFAGAVNPCFVLRNQELIELKGEKISVGTKFKYFTGYSSKKMTLEKKDRVILFTDGIVDQFGGPGNKRFQTVKFKELIKELSNSSIHSPHDFVMNRFQEWKGENEQIDDVLVMGIEIC